MDIESNNKDDGVLDGDEQYVKNYAYIDIEFLQKKSKERKSS